MVTQPVDPQLRKTAGAFHQPFRNRVPRRAIVDYPSFPGTLFPLSLPSISAMYHD